MADDYSKGYEEGREGKGYSGGGSIEYAGWAAGLDAHAKHEIVYSSGGGHGGAINFKGRVVVFGVGFGLIGMFLGLLSDGTVGGVVGFAIAFAIGATVRLSTALAGRIFKGLPFLPALLIGGMIGAVYGVGLAVRSGQVREPLMIGYAIAGAVLFFAVWGGWRLIKRSR